MWTGAWLTACSWRKSLLGEGLSIWLMGGQTSSMGVAGARFEVEKKNRGRLVAFTYSANTLELDFCRFSGADGQR